MKKLRLHLKSVKTPAEINQIKRNFFYELRKNRLFKGKPLELAKQNVSEEECWLKFVAGGIKSNPKRKINYGRVARVHWLFLILDIYFKNNDPTAIYENITESISANKHKLQITIKDKSYHLHFAIIYNKNGTIQKYVLLTAFNKKSRPTK